MAPEQCSLSSLDRLILKTDLKVACRRQFRGTQKSKLNSVQGKHTYIRFCWIDFGVCPETLRTLLNCQTTSCPWAPLSVRVDYIYICLFKFWNQSFDFNEADVYLVWIVNPFINRKKGKKEYRPRPILHYKIKHFCCSFATYDRLCTSCIVVKMT